MMIEALTGQSFATKSAARINKPIKDVKRTRSLPYSIMPRRDMEYGSD
jgi:hypothetical protein